jgi:hypothetical protein
MFEGVASPVGDVLGTETTMKILKTAALVAALAAGSLGLASAPASATPIGAGSSAAVAGAVDGGLVTAVQWGYGRPHYGYRRHYGYRPYYGRPYYRPPVVCRIRYTPWGPRRVCFRRY